jgi:hypothetical protein
MVNLTMLYQSHRLYSVVTWNLWKMNTRESEPIVMYSRGSRGWVRVLCYDRRSAGQHPSGAYDQTFIIVWQLRVSWFGAPSLTRGRVCRLPLLLALASAVIFGSESRRTRGHILLFQIRDFPFRRLLRLEVSRWRYSTPPPHGFVTEGARLAFNILVLYVSTQKLRNFETDYIHWSN